MLELMRELKSQRDWKAGHKYADVVKKEWLDGFSTDEEMRVRIAQGRLRRHNSIDDHFLAGYKVYWQRFGANDVDFGRCRAKKFHCHDYNMGWWNRMVEMHKTGWRHVSLDKFFDEMGKNYWDKINKGRSDDYYTANSNN